MTKKNYPIRKPKHEWENLLDKASYHILREKGTEPAFSGEYNNCYENGQYHCKGCGNQLFEANTKFDSGCGWPSFDDAIKDSVEYHEDRSLSRVRTEIVCSQCGGHLGHVFNDGPTNTGQRYCVNSLSVKFIKEN